MQLKTVGESSYVLSSIDSVLNNAKNGAITSEQSLINLKSATSSYSIEAVKMAICQSKLTNEQIKTILSAKGLEGQTLETTTAELSQIAYTNRLAVAQGGAAASTSKLGYTMKGLGISLKGVFTSIKSFITSHPVLLAAAVALLAITKIIDDNTTSIKEQKEQYQKAKEEYDETASKLRELESELNSTNSLIKELQKKANEGTITLVEQDELKKLQQTNTFLKEQIALQEELEKEKSNKSAKEAVETYKRTNTSVSSDSIYNNSFDSSSKNFQVGSFEIDAGQNIEAYDYAINQLENKSEEYQKAIYDTNLKISKAQAAQNNDIDEPEDYLDITELNAELKNYENLLANAKDSASKLTEKSSSIAEEIFFDKLEEFNDYKEQLMRQMNSNGSFDNNSRKT